MVRTEQQNEELRKARKQKILLEASNQFSTKGFVGTRISDIAKGASMSQGLLYHYYSSKEDIYVDLIYDAMDKLIEASNWLYDADMGVKEKIIFSLEKIFETIRSSKDFRIRCGLISQSNNLEIFSDEIKIKIREKRDVPYEIMAKIFAKGQEEGCIIDTNPRHLATLYWTSINGLAIYYATRDGEIELPDYNVVASMFFK